MPSSQTITPTLLTLGASKNASPSGELKVNNTFNQVFKNEVASKTKKAPVEPVKNPAANKSSITPSNSTSANNKNSAPPVSPTDTATNATTNIATNTISTSSNTNDGQSEGVDKATEDEIRPEDQKLPDLNDPVSLFNFVNKINELSQAHTSSTTTDRNEITKISEVVSTSDTDNLGVATLVAPAPLLKAPELPIPKQASESIDLSAVASTIQESVDNSLPPSRFMSELSTADNSVLTAPLIENQSQLPSLPTSTAVVNSITDSNQKNQADLSQLPMQLKLADANNVALQTPNKPAPPISDLNGIDVVNSGAKSTADSMPPTKDGIQQNTINSLTSNQTPPPSLSTKTGFGNNDTTQTRVLASQLKTNNAIDIKDTRANSLLDQSRAVPVLNEVKKSFGEAPATVAKVDPSSVAPGEFKNLLKGVETPLTITTQVQALPAALGIVIPPPPPADSDLAKDMPTVSLVTPAAVETNTRQVSHGIERTEQSTSSQGSSELFSSTLNTEFARTQQEQTVAEKSFAIEEFAVNKMTSEVTTPTPIVQAPPAPLSSLPVSEYIAARFGTKAWDQAIGQKIVWMVAGGEQTAQLTLNPPDLGPVQVVLSISDSFVDASFVSSHLDVREAIEAAAPKLREMMEDAGISLSGFSVSADSAQSGNPFNSEKSQHNVLSQARNPAKADDVINNAKLNTPAQRTQPELGLVDTFA